ncbi:MAG TPA: PEGA domain-containing protein, partial [Phycisphaerales bacterium]|nr:PEGA domain-containing protein [Phycisphaerales bacterium]
RMPIALSAAIAMTGCVERTVHITSEPQGALVWVNDREIGRTPVSFDFLYYGVYDVRLVKEGYEPLLTSGDAEAPLYETVPVDLLSELAPVDIHSDINWHYVLQPRNDDPHALLQRAEDLRAKLGPPASTQPAATSPAATP